LFKRKFSYYPNIKGNDQGNFNLTFVKNFRSGRDDPESANSIGIRKSPAYSSGYQGRSEAYSINQRQGNWTLSQNQSQNLSARKYFDFKETFGGNLDAANLVSFYDKVQEGKLRPFLPSAYSMLHQSELIDQELIDTAFN
jgi:hypothetical protein